MPTCRPDLAADVGSVRVATARRFESCRARHFKKSQIPNPKSQDPNATSQSGCRWRMSDSVRASRCSVRPAPSRSEHSGMGKGLGAGRHGSTDSACDSSPDAPTLVRTARRSLIEFPADPFRSLKRCVSDAGSSTEVSSSVVLRGGSRPSHHRTATSSPRSRSPVSSSAARINSRQRGWLVAGGSSARISDSRQRSNAANAWMTGRFDGINSPYVISRPSAS